MRTIIFFIVSTFFIVHQSYAQRFKAAAVAGLNFAQIDGDDLYGYSKLGISGGLKLNYPLNSRFDASLEMLYSERGSTSGFGFADKSSNYTTLQYLEVPLLIRVKDWYVDDKDYHKASIHGGLSVGYLFNVDSSNGKLADNLDNFNQTDLSYIFGINYRFTRAFGLTIRYTNAFLDLDDADSSSYFITVRTEYNF